MLTLLDLSLPSPEANLALDEALLTACDEGTAPPVLRFWIPSQWFVVVGYSNSVAGEVQASACAAEQVPVLRRVSGGGAVLQGPGCLNYAVVFRPGPECAGIPAANHWVLERHQHALRQHLDLPTERQGDTDLVLGGRKFSGNAQRRLRQAVLVHGTFLLHFDLSLMERFLAHPSREPAYRAGRPHTDFLMNLPVESERLKTALREVWCATQPFPLSALPLPTVAALVRDKYSQPAWNRKF